MRAWRPRPCWIPAELSGRNAPQTLYQPAAGSSRFVPPPTAFAPALTILKRPVPVVSEARNSKVIGGAREKTLEERERDYAIAKRRIYGTGSVTPNGNSSSGSEKLSLSSLSLERVATPPGAANGRRRPATTNSGGGGTKATNGGSGKGAEVIRKPRGPPTEGAAGFGSASPSGSTQTGEGGSRWA